MGSIPTRPTQGIHGRATDSRWLQACGRRCAHVDPRPPVSADTTKQAKCCRLLHAKRACSRTDVLAATAQVSARAASRHTMAVGHKDVRRRRATLRTCLSSSAESSGCFVSSGSSVRFRREAPDRAVTRRRDEKSVATRRSMQHTNAPVTRAGKDGSDMFKYTKHFSTKATLQAQPIPGTNQVRTPRAASPGSSMTGLASIASSSLAPRAARSTSPSAS